MLAAADAPAQLVQLADAEALGALDEHDRRVGDVDADLDDRRRDEHVGLAGGERRHRLLLLARAHLAVQQRDAVVGSSPPRSRSYSAVAARAASASDSSTSGQTTNAWRPASSSSRMRS